jgi:3-oxoadipate CoA-transferase beta subunit
VAERGWSDEQVAQRVAADFWEGAVVNLGVGMPTLVAGYMPLDREVILHSENGLLGIGPPPAPGQEDPHLVDAGKGPVSLRTGASVFHTADSFAMLRGGHVDGGVMGAYEVSERGDLANWKLPGQPLAGMGGAADISLGARQVWVMMKHRTSGGEPRILRACRLPLTARGVVRRIYTDLAVLAVTPAGLRLMEAAPGLTFRDVAAATEAPLLAQEPAPSRA